MLAVAKGSSPEAPNLQSLAELERHSNSDSCHFQRSSMQLLIHLQDRIRQVRGGLQVGAPLQDPGTKD